MKTNPYSLVFGQEPNVMIPRAAQSGTVLDTFCSENPAQRVFMVSGVRGSGKTVFMTDIAHRLRKHDDWITVELNPKRDMLNSLGSKLSSENPLALIFQEARINLSFFGFGLEVKNSVPISDIETALIKMLASLKKREKKVLITVDEVTSSPEMLVFTHSFQIFLREKLPVFLIMTGLYENIDALQNEKTLTFLHRAPKITLEPLNTGTIAALYAETFHIDRPTSLEMSRLTKGFSYAFQALGYFTWEHAGDYLKALIEYKQHLDEYVYAKIWSELSAKDRKVVAAIAASESGKVEDIRDLLNLTSGEFAPYRDRLIKKGLIDGSTHGHVSFTLPLFEQFAEEHS